MSEYCTNNYTGIIVININVIVVAVLMIVLSCEDMKSISLCLFDLKSIYRI